MKARFLAPTHCFSISPCLCGEESLAQVGGHGLMLFLSLPPEKGPGACSRESLQTCAIHTGKPLPSISCRSNTYKYSIPIISFDPHNTNLKYKLLCLCYRRGNWEPGKLSNVPKPTRCCRATAVRLQSRTPEH